MAQNGYIKLFRTISEWEWYKDSNTKNVFIHLLVSANFEKTKFKGIEVGVGQCLFSLDGLGSALNLSKQEVRTALNHLKSTRELTWVKTPYGLIISIENWDKYQGQSTRTLTHEQHNINTTSTQNQHRQKNIRNKEYKNNKNNITPKTDVSALILAFSDDVDIQNFLFKWLDVRKKKRQPMDAEVIRLNLDQLYIMAEKSGLTVTDYLSEIIRRSWATFYEIPPKKETKKPKQESKCEASYDIEEFRERSLHGELKYERRNKSEQS